jgi:hypothetical protein
VGCMGCLIALIYKMWVSASCEYVQLAYELSNVCRSCRAEVLVVGNVEFFFTRHLITEIYVKTILLCKKPLEAPRLWTIRQKREPQHNKPLSSFVRVRN